jgi:hypothetical protein
MSGFRFLCFHLLIQQQLVEMGERQAAFWPDFSKLPGGRRLLSLSVAASFPQLAGHKPCSGQPDVDQRLSISLVQMFMQGDSAISQRRSWFWSLQLQTAIGEA